MLRLALFFMMFALAWGGPVSAAPFAYVADHRLDQVSVVDTELDAVVTTIPVGDRPFGVAVAPDGREMIPSRPDRSAD